MMQYIKTLPTTDEFNKLTDSACGGTLTGEIIWIKLFHFGKKHIDPMI